SPSSERGEYPTPPNNHNTPFEPSHKHPDCLELGTLYGLKLRIPLRCNAAFLLVPLDMQVHSFVFKSYFHKSLRRPTKPKCICYKIFFAVTFRIISISSKNPEGICSFAKYTH